MGLFYDWKVWLFLILSEPKVWIPLLAGMVGALVAGWVIHRRGNG